MKKALACLLVLLLLLGCAAAETVSYEQLFSMAEDAGKMSVRFLWLGDAPDKDSKPGDSMILTSPDGQVMVLDTGSPFCVDYITRALDTMGVKRIDCLVLSHPHIDHVSGAPTLMEKYEIGTVYTSAVVYETSRYYRAYMDAIANLGLNHVILYEGMSFAFGAEVMVQVFNPTETIEYLDGEKKVNTQFLNNQSLVLKMTYGDSSFLFAGDLYTPGERAVVERWKEELDCDVVKANHHGASTSSSTSWRKALSPIITVITNDKLEDYYIAQRYASVGEVYHTYYDGSVCVRTTGDGTYEVLTEKEHSSTRFAK